MVTDTHTHKQNNYCNPMVHAPRVDKAPIHAHPPVPLRLCTLVLISTVSSTFSKRRSRTAVPLLKSVNQIQHMDEDSEDIYQTSLIDRYAARPDQLNHKCLAEFAANYTTCSGQGVPEDETNDVLPTAEDGESR